MLDIIEHKLIKITYMQKVPNDDLVSISGDGLYYSGGGCNGCKK